MMEIKIQLLTTNLTDSVMEIKIQLLTTNLTESVMVLAHLSRCCFDLQCWPFQQPVNKKMVKDYYEVIKKPMDLSTLHKVLTGSVSLEFTSVAVTVDRAVKSGYLSVFVCGIYVKWHSSGSVHERE